MSSAAPTDWSRADRRARVRRRHWWERTFRLLALSAVAVSLGFLLLMLGTITLRGIAGFTETRVRVPVDLLATRLPVTAERVRGRGGDLALAGAGLEGAVETAPLAAFGPDGAGLLSDGAWLRVRDAVKRDPGLLRRRETFDLPVASAIDSAWKGHGTPQAEAIVARLGARGLLSRGLNRDFLVGADSTDPTRVGIWGALKGSLFTVLVTLGLAFPVGTMAALWLEEFAPRRRWADVVEVAINNLAAVPSIIFGLLGLALFLGFWGLPRSAPIVGGLTLALMVLPIIVITARGAIRAVPQSLREAALSLGASPVQLAVHHVLPQAAPGILTGTIIGTARALGETAPLLLIGMRAFIASPPGSLGDPATTLPVQIFLWSDEVGHGFVEKTSAAILVLLALLIGLNATAVALRHRFEARR
jgi:phosphate transport system permease protein